jgi:hypothetical protein
MTPGRSRQFHIRLILKASLELFKMMRTWEDTMIAREKTTTAGVGRQLRLVGFGLFTAFAMLGQIGPANAVEGAYPVDSGDGHSGSRSRLEGC